MNWKSKKVLVTGAGGFIGSHLTERLVELGASVRALVHYNALGTWGWLDQSAYRNDIDVIAGDVRLGLGQTADEIEQLRPLPLTGS